MTFPRIIILAAISVIAPSFAFAASISFTIARSHDLLAAHVMLSIQDDPINVVEGSLTLPDGAAVDRIETGGSVISVWIEEPRVENGAVRFAGMMPGGFEGTAEAGTGLTGPGELFTLVFADTDGKGTFGGGEAQGYLHDGEGTPVSITLERASYETDAMMLPEKRREEDKNPPTTVAVKIIPSSAVSPALLVVEGNDLETGIDHLELSIDSGTWRTFVSPLELAPLDLKKSIVVRIFDHSGNFREIKVQEGEVSPFANSISILESISVLIVFACLYAWFRRRSRRSDP